jgi:hypothetical protein
MLVAFVQGVIGAFHKNSRPLKHRGGEETCDRTEDNLLEESGVHFGASFESTPDATGKSSKPQAPISKEAPSSNFQIPAGTVHLAFLDVDDWDFPGAWWLGFGF